MIYSQDLDKSLPFYRDLLGLTVLQEFRGGPKPVYARLQSPGSDSTIALHLLEPGQQLHPGAIRLYFEIENLEAFCQSLIAKGAQFTKPPAVMPWGWTHAYLNDPDGHEVSLYWAGGQRLAKA